MSKMRPENIFLTVALSVIGVAAVSGYVAVTARTYDPVDRIPTPEEYALTVRMAEQETEAETVLDTLLAVPETEREPVEITPETEAVPDAPEVSEEKEPEPADTDDAPETTLEEWFALLDERYAPRKYEHETKADETTFDEWIAALEASFAAETKEPDPDETTLEEWFALLDQRYPIDGSVPVRSTDSGSSGDGASISWGVSSTSGAFFDVTTDENSSVTITRTEDGYSSVTTWSDGEGTSSFSGIYVGGLPDDWPTSDSPSRSTSGESPFRTYDREETDDLYIINTNPQAKKIHLPGGCSSVDKISDEHYATTNDLTEYLADGYTYCGNCFR